MTAPFAHDLNNPLLRHNRIMEALFPDRFETDREKEIRLLTTAGLSLEEAVEIVGGRHE
jgi:hypothetical protein